MNIISFDESVNIHTKMFDPKAVVGSRIIVDTINLPNISSIHGWSATRISRLSMLESNTGRKSPELHEIR
jgi:hypothetical protein